MDAVRKILEEVCPERFLPGYFEASERDTPQTDERKIFYTNWGHAVVFHHSGTGLREGVRRETAQCDGWCWQSAAEFKGSKAVVHYGFPSAQEALDVAQAWEYADRAAVHDQVHGQPDADGKQNKE